MLTLSDELLVLLVSIVLVHYIHCQRKFSMILEMIKENYVLKANEDIENASTSCRSD